MKNKKNDHQETANQGLHLIKDFIPSKMECNDNATNNNNDLNDEFEVTA